ncbi:MAG TPA: hypothetical protein VM597_35945 [Gemmataceae bacterium]|jgi:hypothetical protein|nr:hypothetical protein [Gemmataceae bacterium]
MAETPRRRMSRGVPLVLLSALPALLAGCGGESADDVEEVEEEVPPPAGPAHLIGGPFVGWWGIAHPPVIVRRAVPGRTATTRSGSHRSYPRGRSGFLSSFSSGSSRPATASPGVTRGGFGSTGHATAGG